MSVRRLSQKFSRREIELIYWKMVRERDRLYGLSVNPEVHGAEQVAYAIEMEAIEGLLHHMEPMRDKYLPNNP